MRSLIAAVIAMLMACGSRALTTRPDPAPVSGHEAHEATQPATTPDASVAVVATDAGAAPPQDAGPVTTAPVDPPAAERAAYEGARPVFDRFCASCHTRREGRPPTAALRHFDMTVYPFGGHHAANLTATIRTVLGVGGGRPTMPRDDPGAVRGEDLALVTAWADAFDRAHAAGAHPAGHGGGH